MIDIHCHILPGVDDGPETIEESLIMAKEAVNEGIKIIIATPHHMNNKYENNKGKILKQVKNLNELLIENGIPLTILPGQENRIFGELISNYKNGEILTLSHTQYLFIEFPSSSVPKYAERLFYDIQIEGLIPIIVHPERNKQLLDNPELLFNMVNNGALTQVTAASLVGYFGKTIKRFSEQLIEHNLAHFIASDAHNIHNRTFKLAEAYDILNSQFGMDYVHLFMENSELLLENKHIIKEIPSQIKRKKFLGIF